MEIVEITPIPAPAAIAQSGETASLLKTASNLPWLAGLRCPARPCAQAPWLSHCVDALQPGGGSRPHSAAARGAIWQSSASRCIVKSGASDWLFVCGPAFAYCATSAILVKMGPDTRSELSA